MKRLLCVLKNDLALQVIFMTLMMKKTHQISDCSRKTRRYLNLAREVAKKSTYGKLRHGALLVKGGSVISTAYNKSNFNSFGNRFREHDRGPATHHAELGCILGVDKSKTDGATLYVTRVNTRGEYMLSRPCKMCHDILKHCGVKRVIYTINSSTIESYKL